MKTDKNGESSIFQKALAVSPAVHRQSGTSKDLLDAVKQEDIVLLAAVKSTVGTFRECIFPASTFLYEHAEKDVPFLPWSLSRVTVAWVICSFFPSCLGPSPAENIVVTKGNSICQQN